jgi:hypothetical protein
MALLIIESRMTVEGIRVEQPTNFELASTCAPQTIGPEVRRHCSLAPMR